MLEILLNNGNKLVLENCGDDISARLYTTDSDFITEICLDADSFADKLFD